MSLTVRVKALVLWACPLLWWMSIYLGSIVIGDPILRFLAVRFNQPFLDHPGVVSAVAVLFAAAVLEVLLLKGLSCEWVSSIVYLRWLMYGLAFIIGPFIWSGTTTSFHVPIVYRAAMVLIVILPLIAVIVSHSMRSHWGFSESGMSRSFQWLGRVPLILFIMLVLAFLVLAVIEKFFVR